MAEELARHQVGRQGGEVLRHEAAATAGAPLVDGRRDELLADPGLSVEQHARLGPGDGLDLLENVGHRLRRDLQGGPRDLPRDDLHVVAEAGVRAGELLEQPPVLEREPPLLRRALDGEPQLVGVPGLLHVREDVPLVHGHGQIVQVAVPGEQDALRVRVLRAGAREQLGPAHRLHPHVADEDVEGGPRELGERLATARRERHVEVGVEDRVEDVAHVLLVVDVEHADAGGGDDRGAGWRRNRGGRDGHSGLQLTTNRPAPAG